MDRASLKYDAKAAMKAASVSPYGITVIMVIITTILAIPQGLLETWIQLLASDTQFSIAEYKNAAVAVLGFSLIYFAVTTLIQFGYSTYCLKVANRDASMSYGDLFCSIRYFFKALGLMFMIGLFTTLWLLLLVVPGLIAEYRYSQAIFIMAEDPSKGIMQCIRESKEMMDGHKMELFIMQLSFIPWTLLAFVTCGLSIIYVNPYMTVTLANYYNSLKPVITIYRDAEVIG